jgi:protein arginine N-methyltransferase 1
MGSDELQFHAFCLTDTGSRLDQYARAIARTIRPGDVVIDLGAGTGILSFLACAAGARRVYAIESSEAISYAEQLAAVGLLLDRVRFIRSPSSQVVLPERVDAIIGDIHDTFGLQASGIGSVLDARDRLLKPGGVLIPARIDLFAAPVEAHDLYRKTVDVWQQQIHGVDLSPLRSVAVNERYPGRFRPSQLLAPPSRIATIDLMTTTDLHHGGETQVTATRAGTLHGLCGCFVTTLAGDVTIGNVPGDERTTNFAQAFFPIDTPHAIGDGDEIAIRIETYDGVQHRWQVTIAPRDPDARTGFDHATFLSALVTRGALEKRSSDYRPRLTARGVIERELLGKFDGTTSAADLERWLVERFGDQLPSPREAAAFLKATIARVG